jgi:phospholipid/cholesterol/gamma-HCH transport system substrate-binding protein
MITRRVKVQLIVFFAMASIAMGLIVFQYAKIPTLMGVGQIEIQADFEKGAGLYPNANVTYRGVTVGKVKAMHLTPEGVTADLSVGASAEIPRNVTASVKSVSAIGEQYVDLVPKGDGGQRLNDGDRIDVEDTHVPVPVAQVLDDVNILLRSVQGTSLTTVLDEAEKGFRGIGPDLAQMTMDVQALIADAESNYSATRQLIRDAEPVLGTQIGSGVEIRAWAANLDGFAGELKRNDKQVRALFSSVPPAADNVSKLLDALSRDMPRLLQTADVSADLASDYQQSLAQVLSVYPLVAAADIAADSPHRGGQMGLSFKTIANYPGGCSEGWPKAGEPYGGRSSTIIEDAVSAPNAYCRISQDDPRVARGARNLQCFEPGSVPGSRAALITQCSKTGYTHAAGEATSISVTNPFAPLGSTFLGALGRHTNARQPGVGQQTWQDLILEPTR